MCPPTLQKTWTLHGKDGVVQNLLSLVNMLDPIQKHFVTAIYDHYGHCAARIWPDRVCLIQLPASDSVPFFKRHGSYCAEPTRIRSGWPGQGLAKKNASGLEASWCAGIIVAGFWQNTTGLLPVSHFQAWLCSSINVPDHIVQKQPGSNLVLPDCQILAVGKLVCKNHFTRFWPIWIGYRSDLECLLGLSVSLLSLSLVVSSFLSACLAPLFLFFSFFSFFFLTHFIGEKGA